MRSVTQRINEIILLFDLSTIYQRSHVIKCIITYVLQIFGFDISSTIARQETSKSRCTDLLTIHVAVVNAIVGYVAAGFECRGISEGRQKVMLSQYGKHSINGVVRTTEIAGQSGLHLRTVVQGLEWGVGIHNRV